MAVDADDIGGVVTSSNGPEAGVWVIAETTTWGPSSARSSSPMIRANTCCPNFPMRTYKVWVRGYGLVDSPPVETTPGKTWI